MLLKTCLLVLLLCPASFATKEMARFVKAKERAFRKLFRGPRADVLSLEPSCYPESMTENEYRDIEESSTTWDDYYAKIYNYHPPIQIDIQFQLLKIVDVDEKGQTITVVLVLDRSWLDCRLAWRSNETGGHFLLLEPNTLKRFNVFTPGVALLETINPEDTKDSEIQLLIEYTGRVHLQQQYYTTISCYINVRMYPFDVQTCTLTFESVLPDSHALVVSSQGPNETVDINSYNFMAQYKSSEQWTITVLPAEYQRRKTCEMSETDCTMSGVKHLLLLRRHPDYQLINLLCPAFLTVVVSGCVFIVPPGNGDKMGLSVSNLLALYMFSHLMYEKMPETASIIPLLSQYFLTCIALVSTSCVYSAISSLFATASPSVPSGIRRMVELLGPIFLFDYMKSSGSRKARKNANRNQSRTMTNGKSAVTTTVQLKDDHQPTNAAEECEPIDDDLEVISWTIVGALFDRLFFLIHLVVSVTTLILFLTEGYGQWLDFAGYGSNETVMAYACKQGKMQGDLHDHGCP